MVAIVDGHPTDDPRIAWSGGILVGDGLFETMRCDTEIYRFEDHVARFGNGLDVLGLDPSHEDGFRDAAQQILEAKKPGRAMARISFIVDAPDQVRFVSATRPIVEPSHELMARGVHAITSGRKDEGDPLAVIKSLSFLTYQVARRAAGAAGADDAVLLNTQGNIAEATTANLFARAGNTLYAPGPVSGGLPGVTRAAVLEHLQDEDYEVVESLSPRTLRSADEAWLTNTTGIRPLTRIDGETIGVGRPGQLTARLADWYRDDVS